MSGHGTHARAVKHRRDGETPCAECLAAAAYTREWREQRKLDPSTAGARDRSASSMRAYSKALTDLRRRHPEEFAELYRRRQQEVGS